MRAKREKVDRLLKTARGQMDGILKMVDEDRYCVDIVNQVLATQAILRNVNRLILEAHLKGCVKDSLGQQEGQEKIDEIIAIVEKLAK